jgi:DNA-binding Lrp family transcriptional regulator
MNILRQLQHNQNLNVFNPGPQVEELKKIVQTYRGNILSATERRLESIVKKDGIRIIPSNDLMDIIRKIWGLNISKFTRTELQALEGVMKKPELSTAELAETVDLTYNRCRRALDSLKKSTVLRREGRIDAASLGMDRVLIIMTNPSGVITSPFFTRYLYVDGSTRKVFITALVPSKRREDFLRTIASLRSVSDNTTVWALSSGEPRLGTTYYDPSKKKFEFDALHFRLVIRSGGDELTLGEFPVGQVRFPLRFKESETKIIEQLTLNFDLTAQELSQLTNLSASTTFRKRARIVNERIVIPRAKITIPTLSDRVIGVFSGEAASNILHAWAMLPLTYSSMITNLENRQEKKIVFATALPSGSARELLDALASERSQVDDFVVHEIAGGTVSHLPIGSLYDHSKKDWLFNSTFFDVRTYGIVRREASRKDIPIDLV